MPELKKTLGWRYLRDTKFDREKLLDTARPDVAPASPFKAYPETKKILLPRPAPPGDNAFWCTLGSRRSRRRFSGKPLSLENLAMLLWAAQGVTARSGAYLLRTAPSAGGLYPIETYVGAEFLEGAGSGVYHFDPFEFQLEELSTIPPGQAVAQAALQQGFIARAAVTFIWTAVLRRNFSKYGHRGLRYVLMDVGHICQNLLIAAEALGLAACPVAAFYDEELNNILGIDGEEESAVYLAAVG